MRSVARAARRSGPTSPAQAWHWWANAPRSGSGRGRGGLPANRSARATSARTVPVYPMVETRESGRFPRLSRWVARAPTGESVLFTTAMRRWAGTSRSAATTSALRPDCETPTYQASGSIGPGPSAPVRSVTVRASGEGTMGCVTGTDADRHYAPHGQFPLPIAQLLLQACGERGKCLLLEVHAGPEAGPWHGLCWARCRLGAGGLPRHISKI